MKNIKSYTKLFESSEEDFDIDEIKYYFTDLEDVGYNVTIKKSSKLTQSKSIDKSTRKFIWDFNMISFIEVYIRKNPGSPTTPTQLNRFMNSDLFTEVIDVAKDRLGDMNLFIDDDSIKLDEINSRFLLRLNIYKNEDKLKIS
jgi:hypothetical protein